MLDDAILSDSGKNIHPEYIKSPTDSRDWIFENLARSTIDLLSLPKSVDYSSLVSDSINQGDRGTCSAIVAATIVEVGVRRQMLQDLEKNNSIYLSPTRMSSEFIYYHRSTKPASGMYGRDAFNILRKIGTPPDHFYPYGSDDSATPPPELYLVATQYRIGNYAKVLTIDGLKRALHEAGACYLLLPLYKTRPNFWIKGPSETSPVTSHAVTVIGYVDKGFLIKNSWGPHWNTTGTIIFPYSDWGARLECWTAFQRRSSRPLYDSSPELLAHSYLTSTPPTNSDSIFAKTNTSAPANGSSWCIGDSKQKSYSNSSLYSDLAGDTDVKSDLTGETDIKSEISGGRFEHVSSHDEVSSIGIPSGTTINYSKTSTDVNKIIMNSGRTNSDIFTQPDPIVPVNSSIPTPKHQYRRDRRGVYRKGGCGIM
jgi:hypothetical protein